MKVTPRITADFDEYPELRVIIDVAVRRVVELMELHDIIELRRIRKNGVFDHPYVKDVVNPIGLRVPGSVQASRFAAGRALLDYLETVGVQGISLEMTQEDAAAIASIWSAPKKAPAPQTKPEQGKTNSKKPDIDPVKIEPETDKTDGATEVEGAGNKEKTVTDSDKSVPETKNEVNNNGKPND